MYMYQFSVQCQCEFSLYSTYLLVVNSVEPLPLLQLAPDYRVAWRDAPKRSEDGKQCKYRHSMDHSFWGHLGSAHGI